MAQSANTTMQPTEKIEDFLICSICHSDLQCTVTTTCGHRYCSPCIGQWLSENQTCPCCNNQLQHDSLIQDRQFDSFVEIMKIELRKREETSDNLEAELSSLNDNLAEKDATVRQTQSQKRELESTIAIFKQETKRLKDEITEKELRFKKEKDNFVQKLSSAQAQLRETNQLLKETAKNLETEQAQSRKLRGDLEMSECYCQELADHSEFLQYEKSLLQIQLESLKQIDETCRLLNEKINEIEEDRHSYIEKNCKLSSENAALLEQKEEHRQELMRGKLEISQVKQTLLASKERIKRMQETNKALQEKNERLKEDLYKKEQKFTVSRHFLLPEQ